MSGWEDNSVCILDYLDLFQSLAAQPQDQAGYLERWRLLQAQELATPDTVVLAPRLLRERFNLSLREYLLAMAALALEMDGQLRAGFRRRFGLALPTVEYGLELIAPLCPSAVETLGELTGHNLLTGLLLTAAGESAYPLERPLILCRAAAAFLTGLSAPEYRGVTLLLPPEKARYLPIHSRALEQLTLWYHSGGAAPLYLHGQDGCGRRTLLLRGCGGAVCVELSEGTRLSPPDREQLCREGAVLSRLLSVPVCGVDARADDALAELLWLCREWDIPLVVVTQEEDVLAQAGEVIRLPSQLTPRERDEGWRAVLPGAEPDSVPPGGMSIGALRETAGLALRLAGAAGRTQVRGEDTRRALRQRGGALAFGIQYDPGARLEDMVLPEEVMEQLRQICTAARYGRRLAGWGVPVRNEGVTAVFHGPSGTGKTMAAHAVARALEMPLLRADLSEIMDKYVGETEKHLGRLMQSARENRCVLLFDEADALFGKRAGISTGHDKFANLSTSFLLQEIEQYDGVALLSTNLLQNFDEAFIRRLSYVVRFVLPDARQREKLWRRALPPDRLTGPIPFRDLARPELSPARINGVARAAAVAAMSAGKNAMDAADVVRALGLELQKSGKTLPRELSALLAEQGVQKVETAVTMM